MLFGLVFAQLPDRNQRPIGEPPLPALEKHTVPQPRLRMAGSSPAAVRAVPAEPLPLASLGIGEEVLRPCASWRWLDQNTRAALDRGGARQGRWQAIVLHPGHQAGLSAAALARYQCEVRGITGGPAWHFHLGDGSNGVEIRPSERWTYQLDAPHTPQARDSRGTLAVYVAGDFEQNGISSAQLAALNELVCYLRAKLGSLPVRVVEGETMGRGFPAQEIAQSFNRDQVLTARR